MTRRLLALAIGLLLAAAVAGWRAPAGAAVPAGEIVPDPLEAPEDLPDAYARGCHTLKDSYIPGTCTYGDPNGDVTVAVVGDSKILQWISALDRIGEQRGWRIRLYSMSACSFSAATIVLDGAPYENCTRWNAIVVERLLRYPPDVVLTSQGSSTALNDPNDVSAGRSSRAMVRGLRDRWRTLTSAGIDVVVLRDNPYPPNAAIYRCVAEHRANPDACAFAREPAERRGAGDVLLAAAQGMPSVGVVDMNDHICPGETCPPVIDDVLLYREGSHLTDTFASRMTRPLAGSLTPIVNSGGLLVLFDRWLRAIERMRR